MRLCAPNSSFFALNASESEVEAIGASQIARCDLPRLGYTVTEAAQVTSISKSKLWELIKSGELGSVKVSGRRIVRHSDLVALLNKETI